MRSSAAWWPTSRSACCCRAASTPACWWRCWRKRGRRGSEPSASGSRRSGGLSGDEFVYSDLVAQKFATNHQQIRIDNQRLLTALDGALTAMSEPMISHDAVAFYLLSQEVAQHVKVVQCGQGADEIFAGYDWYPPLGNVPRRTRWTRTRASSSIATERRSRRSSSPTYLPDADVSRQLVAAHFDAPGAETTLDAALRIDTTIMLVDDPVKRVDNMTMAWGLEARVPFLDHEVVELAAACPPELKLAHGGKGILKDLSRGLVPNEVIDRPKGYFPVPGIRHLEGQVLEAVRAALTNRRGARTGALPRRLREAAVRVAQRTVAAWGSTSSGNWACSSSGCSDTCPAPGSARLVKRKPGFRRAAGWTT